MTYAKANELLTGRCKEQRKLGNHTYLVRLPGNRIAISLHNTNVVTFCPDGSTILNSGGWRTHTTKERMNAYGPVNIWAKRGIWYVGQSYKDKSVIYADNMTIDQNGKIIGAGSPPDMKLLKAARKYASAFMTAFAKGEVPKPSGGDCWYCGLVTNKGEPLGKVVKATDHILFHIEESYFVPSLMANAIERFPVSNAARWYINSQWGTKEDCGPFAAIGKRQIEKSIYRYVKEALSFAA